MKMTSAFPIHMTRLSMLFCGIFLVLMPATASGTAVAAMASEASGVRHRHRHKRSHRHHRRHHHRHRAHNKTSAGVDKKELTLEIALDRMPTKVSEMFAQFQTTKDPTKAVDVLDQLNLVYERALSQKDTLTPDCEDKRYELSREVSTARSGLKDVEGHLTRLQGHMQTLQSGVDRNLAEVESLREQYDTHRAICKKNKAASANMLALLQKDMPTAKKLNVEATKSCRLPTPIMPGLTECSLPNGEFVTTFKLEKFRAMISNCSSITEKMAALNLDRAVRSRSKAKKSSAASSFVQLQAQRLRGATVRKQHRHGHHRHSSVAAPAANGIGLLQRYLAHRTIPKAWCSDVTPAPACASFTDSMDTFLGNVEDLMRDLLGKSQMQEDHCRASLESYEEQVKALRRQADDGSVALANAAAEHSELATLRRERRAQVQDVDGEASREVATCGQQIHDFEATLCSTKKLKKEMGKLAGKGFFMGDCEVGDWVRGTCSKSCGTTGVQTLTRDVIDSPGAKPKCPSLKFSRPCNRRPCPMDGEMGGWEPWSGCSRACDGGTRSRHRRVLKEARHGGLPAAETMQEQLCNTQACDQDCLLAEWTPWTNCSKACKSGHRSRVRKAIRPPLGEGTCAGERSAARLQTVPCAQKACNNTKAVCTEEVDVAIVLDVSGSVGAVNTEKLKLFSKSIVARLQLGKKGKLAGATVGLVFFGSKAAVASPLTAKSSELVKSLTKVIWQKDSTNTAQALGVARTLFEERGRPTAKQVVIVVTDGMPESAFLTGVEVGRLKEQGARLSFVAVGKSVSKHVLQRWASWPWEENVVSAASFAGLNSKKVTEILANVCGASYKGLLPSVPLPR